MGWLNKIFKGSSHKISEGNYHGRYQGDTVQNEPSCSGDVWAETENEDIDRAIALSLSEEEQKGKKVIDNEFQLEEDEQLARAIQESLNIESPPQHGNGNGNGNIYQPIPFPYSTGFRICAGCNTEIGHGRFLSCMGAVWHPECFRCHGCGYPISDYEYSMNGNYPYHKSCYKEHYHPKCDVCKHFIPTNPAGLIEYRAHPFWVQKYCPSHEHDRTPRCCSCERMEPRDTRYVALNDGRKLCLECLDSAIMDTNECQPLYLDIQEFYEGLNMKVQQQVPLLLVERQALNEAMEGEKSGHHHMPETRGLCLSEEQTVSTILRRPKIGTGNRVMNMITEPCKLTRRCDVTAVLILYGLPRFAHFSSSTQQPLNADLLAFLLRSQSLLTSCLEDYWAAYDRSGYDNADFSSSQLQKIAERNALHQTQSTGTKDTTSSSLTLDAQQKVTDLMARRNPEKIPHSRNKLSKASCKVGTETRTLVEAGRTAESEALHQNLLRKSSMKLISTSSISPMII